MHIFCNAPGPEAYYAIKDSFILAGLTVTGRWVQDCFCHTLGTFPVQSDAVWTLQCTGHLREVDRPGPTRIAVVPLPSLP